MIRRFVPIVSWLPRYEKAQLSRDAIAGVTIWACWSRKWSRIANWLT